MWCFVSEPNGTIHELTLPRASRGSECLDMVASRIHLVEKDYFGLWYKPRNGPGSWLNLRNKLCDEVRGKAPYRFQLGVKFFVNVQELQQQVTRDLFYSTILQQMNSGKLSVLHEPQDIIAKLLAFVAQIDFGDFRAESLPEYSTLIKVGIGWSEELQQLVETEHLKLDLISSSEAKIEFIKLVTGLSDCGVEKFCVFSSSKKPEELLLSVCHDGLRIYSRDDVTKRMIQSDGSQLLQFITYDEISTVSYKGKRFTIIHGDSRSENLHSTFLLKRNQGAINLFRTFTEFHSFFQCNIVKKSVIEKCSKSSFGRLLSLFRSNSEVGTLFLFDVFRTRRQAYNHAWSILNAPHVKRQSTFYQSERRNRKSVYSLSKLEEMNEYRPSIPFNLEKQPASDMKFFQNFANFKNDEKNSLPSPSKKLSALSVKELREAVNDLLDTQICQVCMDAKVSTAFCPCGHIVCCVSCASLCRECPLCRIQITYAQRVFFSSI